MMSVSKARQREVQQETELFNATAAAEKRHQQEALDALREKHAKEIQETVSLFEKQKEELKSAYDVSISELAARMQKELEEVRMGHEERVDAEKKTQETEFSKLEARHEKRMSSFVANQEKVIANLHEDYQRAQLELQERLREIEDQL